MRKPLVAGNWKLNGSKQQNQDLVSGLVSKEGVDVLVCPPIVYLPQVAELIVDKDIQLGVQNIATEESGAFTGEVSATMIKEFGATHAIIGHSERRTVFAEDDNLIAKRFLASANQGIVPVLCVGETLEEREAGQAEAVIKQQLDSVIDVTELSHWENAVIAYEPVWAIGTGVTASPEQAQAMHAAIREMIAQSLSQALSDKIQILYGGSVKPSNASELFGQQDIDGGLIGGASLKADDFNAIVNAAAS